METTRLPVNARVKWGRGRYGNVTYAPPSCRIVWVQPDDQRTQVALKPAELERVHGNRGRHA